MIKLDYNESFIKLINIIEMHKDFKIKLDSMWIGFGFDYDAMIILKEFFLNNLIVWVSLQIFDQFSELSKKIFWRIFLPLTENIMMILYSVYFK